ncbi:hypothetical protein SAMN04488023_13444 [Pedobacter rhizosphaerae]|uniref:Uncharacterized protein n=1 Tax=Pedobacter rhizosphaerae TaxID=390241 RepID=A0A1H9UWX2_9SPHI|nr:hypothetical protein SAMN04488023_13444 [Pedobacter rhizosphaerae]
MPFSIMKKVIKAKVFIFKDIILAHQYLRLLMGVCKDLIYRLVSLPTRIISFSFPHCLSLVVASPMLLT